MTTTTRTRPVLLAQMGATVVVSAALMALTHWGLLPLELGVFALQVLLVLGVLALVDAPAALGVLSLGMAAAVASLVVVHVDEGRVRGLAAVTALAVVAGLLQQLARRDRSRVTESLADGFIVVLLVCSAACLPAAAQQLDGPAIVRTGLLAAAAAVVVGRLGDAALRRWTPTHDPAIGGSGMVLALGVAVALAVPEAGGHLTTREAMLVGLVCAATALTADLFAELAAAELATQHDTRRLTALRPVTVLLPFALVGPVLLVCVRLLERG